MEHALACSKKEPASSARTIFQTSPPSRICKKWHGAIATSTSALIRDSRPCCPVLPRRYLARQPSNNRRASEKSAPRIGANSGLHARCLLTLQAPDCSLARQPAQRPCALL